MEYMDVKTAGEKWGITPRRVRILCNDGRIDGAVRNGWSWVIPASNEKPSDGRILRKFKSLDIRPGNVDVEKLNSMKRSCPLSLFFSEKLFNPLLARTISSLFALTGEEVKTDEIMTILSGFLSHESSLHTHILVINFSSLLRELSEKENKWTEGDMKRLYSSLMRGVVKRSESYSSQSLLRGEETINKEDAVSLALSQYDSSWSDMHPLSSSVIFTGELMRIGLYSVYGVFFYYLIFSSILMKNGFIPPSIPLSSINEMKADYALISKKGVYTDMTELLERLMESTYREISGNV